MVNGSAGKEQDGDEAAERDSPSSVPLNPAPVLASSSFTRRSAPVGTFQKWLRALYTERACTGLQNRPPCGICRVPPWQRGLVSGKAFRQRYDGVHSRRSAGARKRSKIQFGSGRLSPQISKRGKQGAGAFPGYMNTTAVPPPLRFTPCAHRAASVGCTLGSAVQEGEKNPAELYRKNLFPCLHTDNAPCFCMTPSGSFAVNVFLFLGFTVAFCVIPVFSAPGKSPL